MVTQPCPPDNTSEFVNQQIKKWSETKRPIHPESAMEIASWFSLWQTVGSPGIAAFASTGIITDSLLAELNAERESANDPEKPNVDWSWDALEQAEQSARAAKKSDPAMQIDKHFYIQEHKVFGNSSRVVWTSEAMYEATAKHKKSQLDALKDENYWYTIVRDFEESETSYQKG